MTDTLNARPPIGPAPTQILPGRVAPMARKTDVPDVLAWAADQLAPIVAALDPMPDLGELVVDPRHRWLDDRHGIEVTFTLSRRPGGAL